MYTFKSVVGISRMTSLQDSSGSDGSVSTDTLTTHRQFVSSDEDGSEQSQNDASTEGYSTRRSTDLGSDAETSSYVSSHSTPTTKTPVPAPRTPRSARTLYSNYSTDFEMATPTPRYSDDFETTQTHSRPGTVQESAYSDDFETAGTVRGSAYSDDFETTGTVQGSAYSDDFETTGTVREIAYSDDFETTHTRSESVTPQTTLYSDEFEAVTHTPSRPTTPYSPGRFLPSRTSANFTHTLEVYQGSSEGSYDASETLSEETLTEEARSYRSVATDTYSTETRSEGEYSSTETDQSEASYDYSQDTSYDDEVSEATKQAEKDAHASFIARKLGQLSGSRASHQPKPPITPRRSVTSTPRSSITPRTPRIVPQPTPRSTIPECQDFCQRKLQVLQEKRHGVQGVREETVPRRWWDEISEDRMEDYGISSQKLSKLKMDNFMRRIHTAAQTKVHNPKKCAECRDLIAETAQRDFVKQKYSVVSERNIEERIKNPLFLTGDVITRLGENLKAMPRIHAAPEDTLERLMKPLQDNYIMMKRVSVDVADEAARACGAPTDRQEFWNYFLQPFHRSHFYQERKSGQVLEAEDKLQSQKDDAQHIACDMNTSYDDAHAVLNSYRKQSLSQHISRDHSLSCDHSREQSVLSPSLFVRSLSKNSVNTDKYGSNEDTDDDTGSGQPNRIFNMDDLELAKQLSQSNNGSFLQENTQSVRSSGEDSYRPNHVYNMDDLDFASNTPRSNHAMDRPKSASMSYDESSSYHPNNIYNIDDLPSM